jgi:hypothetical protein
MVACVVTAFYKIPSKCPVEQYLEWIEPFFTQMPFHLVMFTQADMVPIFKKMREKWLDRTLILEFPFHEFNAFKKWNSAMWTKALQDDIEIPKGVNHSIELYATWYEKKEFVLKAIEMNAFGANRFVWCDAGILRYPDWLQYMQAFPLEEYIPVGRMTLLMLVDFEPEENEDTVLQGVNRIGGGIQAADADTWRWWSTQYDSMMIKYQLSNRFVGKDQSLMASVALQHPHRVNLIRPDKALDEHTKWFWLLLYLAGVRIEQQ